MSTLTRRRIALAVSTVAVLWTSLAAPAASTREAVLAPTTPAAVGLSAERLARLDRSLDAEIADKRKAGAVVTQAQFLVDLPDLGGADALRADGIEVTSLVAFEGH